MSLIECDRVFKIYKLEGVEITALHSVDLKIEKGEFVSIVGPSGSGKSTLMHVIGLLDKPTTGRVSINNQDVSYLNQNQQAEIRSAEIGFVFQSFNLLARTSALDNVVMPIIYSRERKNIKKRASAILEKVGLGNRLKNTPGQLSGGQQQRVAIARALINNPKIILADEPTGNLDSKSGKEILNLLKSLNQEGRTVIIVTHDQEIAKETNRQIKMMDGKLT